MYTAWCQMIKKKRKEKRKGEGRGHATEGMKFRNKNNPTD